MKNSIGTTKRTRSIKYYIFFSYLEKTVQIYLNHFHCCYKFAVRTGAIYVSDLGCHLSLDYEDFGISSKSMGDKAFT